MMVSEFDATARRPMAEHARWNHRSRSDRSAHIGISGRDLGDGTAHGANSTDYRFPPYRERGRHRPKSVRFASKRSRGACCNAW